MSRLPLIACFFIVAPASAQSLNIDFGTSGSVPSDQYAAAGLPGRWNDIASLSSNPTPLVGRDGNPVAATISAQPFPELAAMSINDRNTRGDDEALFDDFLPGAGDVAVSLSFAGLENGAYTAITYAWVPTAPPQAGSTVFTSLWNGQIVEGPWPGAPAQFVTHAVHDVDVTDGTLTISLIGSNWSTSGVFNGVQLMKTPNPDINGDGVVGVEDLLIVITNWNDGHGCDGIHHAILPCPGDLNNDSWVDVDDLLIVIAEWG